MNDTYLLVETGLGFLRAGKHDSNLTFWGNVPCRGRDDVQSPRSGEDE